MVGDSRPKLRPGVDRDAASRTVFSLSEKETFELGRTLGRRCEGGELILLDGELGLGKTVLARGIAAGLGIEPETVSSPSFTLIQEYTGGRVDMFHVDLYRIDGPEQMATLGVEEVLDSGRVVVVEWGEKLPAYLRRAAVVVRLHDAGEGSRRIEVLPADPPPRPAGDA